MCPRSYWSNFPELQLPVTLHIKKNRFHWKRFCCYGKTFQCSQVFYETDVEVSSKQDVDIWNSFCFTRFFFFRNPIETFENQLFLKAWSFTDRHNNGLKAASSFENVWTRLFVEGEKLKPHNDSFASSVSPSREQEQELSRGWEGGGGTGRDVVLSA